MKVDKDDVVRVPNDVKDVLIILPNGEVFQVKAEDLRLFIKRRGRRSEGLDGFNAFYGWI